MFKTSSPFPVYCHDCWWGDNWNPLSFGKRYDFSRPFFEQFMELERVVPRPAVYETDNVNSEYCNHAAHMKNGYLMFGSWFTEDCSYGQTVLESKDCWDCLFIKNSETCYMSFDCEKCYRTHFSQNCGDCIDSMFLYDCRNCQNCLFSFNLRNKSYYVRNNQVTKEEFEKTKSEVLSSYSKLARELEDFRKSVQRQALHKFYTGERNNNVSGDFIYNSKNVIHSHYINDGENERYAVRGGKGQKEAMDVFGVHAGELVYQCNNMDFSSRTFFSVNGENNIDSSYLIDSFNAVNSFGCISLRNKKFCILNKQYPEEEYKDLRGKIITQMSEIPYTDKHGRRFSYGDFFPIEAAPFSYNESLAQDYAPLTERKATELGYVWHNMEDKSYTATKIWNDLPETIGEVTDSILSDVILCQAWDEDKEKAKEHKCTKGFKITPAELAVYRRLNMPLPRKCPNSRNYDMFRLRTPVEFHKRVCQCDGAKSENGAYKNTAKHFHESSHCPNKFETCYSPERPEVIYCEQCYKAEIV
jgi:hypothetical protein